MRANGQFTLFNPPENEPLAFDFTSQLAPSESISSVTEWRCSVMSGGKDPNAANLLVGNPSLTGNITVQMFDSENAVPGLTYAIAALVASPSSPCLVLWAPLPVKAIGVP